MAVYITKSVYSMAFNCTIYFVKDDIAFLFLYLCCFCLDFEEKRIENVLLLTYKSLSAIC